MNKKLVLIVCFLGCISYGYAQELFTYTEPASNMASRSIGLRLNNTLYCLISVFLFVLFFSGIIFLVSWKISEITNDWTAIKHNLNSHYANIQLWILQHYKVNYSAQETYFFQFTGKAFGGNNQYYSIGFVEAEDG